jgi:acyl-CoA dehydrogenase
MLTELRSEVAALHDRLREFMRDVVEPGERLYWEQHAASADRWSIPAVLDELKAKARQAGLWNLFLPESEYGAGLTNREYAPLCELMGRSKIGPEVFNCNAPDTGNMEVLVRYGTAEQKKQWLEPLLAGEIRSAFAMTEPDVASSDATNIEARIERQGNEYVINARKWWTSGAMDPRCKILIFMGKTDPGAPRHLQQSMVLVPMDTPGVTVVRPLSVRMTNRLQRLAEGNPARRCILRRPVRVRSSSRSNDARGVGVKMEAFADLRVGPASVVARQI